MYPIQKTVSAGGFVLKKHLDATEVLVVKRYKDIEPKWHPVLCQLPKGAVLIGETLEQAAVREVREETGYATLSLGKAGTASWKYSKAGRQWLETVHYFFMKPISLRPGPQDGEFEEVCWVVITDAIGLLSYPEERELLSNAFRRHVLTI